MTKEHKEKLRLARESAKRAKEVLKENKDRRKETKEAPSIADDLSVKMDSVIAGLNTVSGALVKLVELQSAPKIEQGHFVGADKGDVSVAGPVGVSFNPKLDDETYPSDYIPPKFRNIVDTILSKDFGIQITDFPDRTDFQVNIVVPEKYSSVAKEDKVKGVQDIRSRIIPRALGENGVREWCTLIRNNLSRFYSKEGVQSPFNNNQ